MSTIEPRPGRRTHLGPVWAAPVGVPESLTSKGFRVRGLGPLPEDFDPTTATARELAVFRLPRRPDANEEPELRDLWERMIARTKRWILPEFVHRPHISHGPPQRTRHHRGTDADSASWSGAIDFAPQGTSYTFVGGQWTVPSSDVTEDGSHLASEWVGLDGWNSANVLQAGTETNTVKLLFFHHTQVYAWWEWWPAGEIAIGNLPVAPGDRMYCLICIGTNHATIHFSNLSQGVGTRFEVTPPSDARLVGNAAEWIVERPAASGSDVEHGGDVSGYFFDCIAGDCTGVDDRL